MSMRWTPCLCGCRPRSSGPAVVFVGGSDRLLAVMPGFPPLPTKRQASLPPGHAVRAVHTERKVLGVGNYSDPSFGPAPQGTGVGRV